MAPTVVFDHVSKKFRRGERHDSLRDLVPSLVRRVFNRRPADTLDEEEFWALKNVSFAVAAGEALGIIGANGAGKSTALKVLTRILKPTSGRCAVRGRVGALIEVAAGFHPDLTGRENVFLQGAIMGMTRAEIGRRFSEIVEFAGVGEFIDTPVKRYSSGMNARLGFSIAAHLSPDALIIDEVLSVGDMAFQQKCFDRMLEFKRQGIAIVFVSHNLQAVSTLCEQAVYLAGEVKAAGPTTAVLDQYVRTSRTGGGTASAAVDVLSAAFTPGPETGAASREVTPGARLTLRVAARTRAPLHDATFGFAIFRSTDNLSVYNGHVHGGELGLPAAFTGEFVVDFQFAAHLLRGHYYVSVYVLHTATLDFLLAPLQIATLAVQETRSRAGVADIEFSAALAAPVSAPNQAT